MNGIIKDCSRLLDDEEKMRREIINYLVTALYLLSLIPFIAIVTLNVLGFISDPASIIVVIVAVPIEIIGVFGIISKGLFSNSFRKSLPDMVVKFFESEMTTNHDNSNSNRPTPRKSSSPEHEKFQQ